MTPRSKTPPRAAFFLAAVAVAFLASIYSHRADAHVLEGPYILELTAEAIGKITSLKANQKLLIYPESPDEAPTVFDETVIYVMPERFRSDLVSDRIQRTHLVFADHSLTAIDGRIVPGQDPFDLYQRLLRSRTRPQLMRTLNNLGIETAISSLGRVEETVVFVLGARYPDESVSQLAVDKETFFPVRLLLIDREPPNAGRRLEIHYRNWQQVQAGWFPMQVAFYIDRRLVREIRVSDLRSNPSIPPEMMDLDALRASVAMNNADSPQEQKQEAVEAVQQAVQNFQKKFD